MDADRCFMVQVEPLWVGARIDFDAVSGRVVGWVLDRSGRPPDAPTEGARARVLVMVDRTSVEVRPLQSFDPGWPMVFCATREEAWAAAQAIRDRDQAEFTQRMRRQDQESFERLWGDR